MTDLRQAAQQALDALERADKDDFWREQRDAITALRAALAENALQRLTDVQQEMELVIDCPRCGHCCPQRKPLTDELYNELLFAVGSKYPDETRHQTALRYIKRAEMRSASPAKAAHGIKEGT